MMVNILSLIPTGKFQAFFAANSVSVGKKKISFQKRARVLSGFLMIQHYENKGTYHCSLVNIKLDKKIQKPWFQ